MQNSEDRKLIAINELINKYELSCNKAISQENEQCLDIIQLSNLHKLEMLTNTVEIAQGLDLNHSVKEYVEEQSEEKTRRVKTVSTQTECSTESEYEKFYNKIESAAKKVDKIEIKNKAYKKTIKGIEQGHEYLTDKIKKYEDELNCIDCKPNIGDFDLIPSFEFSWELKQFLSNLKSLLKDIQGSLDDEALLKDICNFYGLIKENALCLSSYPMILASVPVLITKAKFELMEIGLSWTGIIGPLIASLLGAVTKVAELLKNIIDSGFSCILRAFALMKNTIDSISRLVNSIVEQAELVGSLDDYVLDAIKNFNEKETKPSVRISANERGSKGLSPKDLKNKIKQNPNILPKSEGKLGFRFQHSREFRNYQQASLYAKSSKKFRESRNLEKYSGLETLKGAIVTMEDAVKKSQKYIMNIAFKIISTLKAISRMIIEPIFVSAKVIGEIKVLLNLGRLIKLVIKLANKGFKNICSDFDNEKNNVILVNLIEEEFASSSITFETEPETGKTIALANNKYSGYARRIEPNDCGEVFVKVNETQRNLDLVYDSIAKALG